MAITFRSLGHILATFIEDVLKAEPAIETVTAAIPKFGPLLLSGEQVIFAVAGELASILAIGSATAKQSLLDAGVDVKVIESVDALIASYPSLAAFTKAMNAKLTAAATNPAAA